MASSKPKVKVANKKRSVAPSAPEVKVAYKVAGRETMAAIEQELAATHFGATEAPVIEISETPAGRETLAAIAEELAQDARPRQNTLPYADRISNAPGAKIPGRAPAAPRASAQRPSDAPQLTVTDADRPTPAETAPDGVEIFELLTFIVRGEKVASLTSDKQRRDFVRYHLAHRLPGGTIDGVERIEVTPWTTKSTVVLRVWCRA